MYVYTWHNSVVGTIPGVESIMISQGWKMPFRNADACMETLSMDTIIAIS